MNGESQGKNITLGGVAVVDVVVPKHITYY